MNLQRTYEFYDKATGKKYEKSVDWGTYLFHASGVDKLMTGIRGNINGKGTPKKADLLIENPEKYCECLSETAKSELLKTFYDVVYDWKEEIHTKPVDKGTAVESETIELYAQVTGTIHFKNEKTLTNDYFIGTPDIIDEENQMVKDAKSPISPITFHRYDRSTSYKRYFHQLNTYMDLTGYKSSELIVGLVDAPIGMISAEGQRLNWSMNDHLAAEEAAEQLHTFGQIPPEKRLIVHKFERDDKELATARNRVKAARAYLAQIDVPR